MGTKLHYSLLAAFILAGCGAIPDQGGNSRDSGVFTSTGQPSPDSAPIFIPIAGNLNPEESDGDSAPEAAPPAPEIEVSAPAVEGVAPSADIPTMEGNTDIPAPSSPQVDPGTGPVATAPDTLGYGKEGCDPTGLLPATVTIEATGQYFPHLDDIILSGSITVKDSRGHQRWGCIVEATQTTSDLNHSSLTGERNLFQMRIKEYDVYTVEMNGLNTTLAAFQLQVFSWGENVDNYEVGYLLGAPITVRVIAEYVGPDMGPIPAPVDLNGRIEAPNSSIVEQSGSAPKTDLPNTNAPTIPLNTNQPPASRESQQNPLGLPRR